MPFSFSILISKRSLIILHELFHIPLVNNKTGVLSLVTFALFDELTVPLLHFIVFEDLHDLVVNVLLGVDSPRVVQMRIVLDMVDLQFFRVEVIGQQFEVLVGDHSVAGTSENVGLEG